MAGIYIENNSPEGTYSNMEMHTYRGTCIRRNIHTEEHIYGGEILMEEIYTEDTYIVDVLNCLLNVLTTRWTGPLGLIGNLMNGKGAYLLKTKVRILALMLV